MMFERGYDRVNDFVGDCSRFDIGHPFGYIGTMIGMFAFLVLAVVLVVLFVKRAKHKRPDDEVLQSLKIRFAKGEITEEEYLRRKKILD